MGRDADQAQIVVAHASCSRLHARIAFDSAGTPWLRDLASTHGTRVNKKALPAAACGKTESNGTHAGARGVVLYPADLLQLGASSRLFTLEGPEEFGRMAVRRVPHPLVQASLSNRSSPSSSPAAVESALEAAHDKSSTANEDSGVTWGIDMDDPVGAGNDEAGTGCDGAPMKLPSTLTDADIPQRLRKDWEAWRALQYKLTHTKEESERIRRKGDLSEGQEKQLEKNQERIDNLRQEMDTKEAFLYRRLYPEKVNLAKQRQAEKSAYYEEDEVEDRTRDRNHMANLMATDEAETEESLTRKRSILMDTRGDVEAVVRSHASKHSELKRQIAAMKFNGEEEVFFIQNEVDMAADALKKEKAKLGEIDTQLEQVCKLLKVVNPKLVFAIPPTDATEPEFLDNSGFTMPMPVSRTAVQSTDDDAFQEPEMLPPRTSLPPPKRRRVQGAAMPPPAFAAPTPVLQNAGATTSTFLPPPPRPPPQQEPPHHNRKLDPKASLGVAAATTSDEKHDKWQAPKDQDGSGITKLNAKFGGRY
jgi:hypothetical protein